jgi:hypothetical protein
MLRVTLPKRRERFYTFQTLRIFGTRHWRLRHRRHAYSTLGRELLDGTAS